MVVGTGGMVGVGAAVVDGAAVVAVLVFDPVGADPDDLVEVVGRGVVGGAVVAGFAPEAGEWIFGVADEGGSVGGGFVHVFGLVAAVSGADDDADGWCSWVRGAGSPGTWTTPA